MQIQGAFLNNIPIDNMNIRSFVWRLIVDIHLKLPLATTHQLCIIIIIIIIGQVDEQDFLNIFRFRQEVWDGWSPFHPPSPSRCRSTNASQQWSNVYLQLTNRGSKPCEPGEKFLSPTMQHVLCTKTMLIFCLNFSANIEKRLIFLQFTDVRIVYEMPVRAYTRFSDSSVLFCDYLFQDESLTILSRDSKRCWASA